MINIYHDSNDILTIEFQIGIINLDIQIKSYVPYWIDDLFDYTTHYLWIKQAYGLHNPNDDLFYFQKLRESEKYAGKKLVLLPYGQWSWESENFELDNIPF